MLQLELVYDVKVILLVSLAKNIWGCSWRNISINCNDNVSNIMVMCVCVCAFCRLCLELCTMFKKRSLEVRSRSM